MGIVTVNFLRHFSHLKSYSAIIHSPIRRCDVLDFRHACADGVNDIPQRYSHLASRQNKIHLFRSSRSTHRRPFLFPESRKKQPIPLDAFPMPANLGLRPDIHEALARFGDAHSFFEVMFGQQLPPSLRGPCEVLNSSAIDRPTSICTYDWPCGACHGNRCSISCHSHRSKRGSGYRC